MNKKRFEELKGLMMVEFSKDTMIYPKETAQFGSLDAKGNHISMKDQDIYKNDSFGLKTLDEAGKIKMYTVDGDHLRFS